MNFALLPPDDTNRLIGLIAAIVVSVVALLFIAMGTMPWPPAPLYHFNPCPIDVIRSVSWPRTQIAPSYVDDLVVSSSDRE